MDEKKIATSDEEMDKVYDPHPVEEKWYKYWLDSQLFRASEKNGRPAYSMVIPPPNVTGTLHMGHALNNTLQDIMARLRRMQGYNVLWMPGTDHAGIATQNVVERKLAEEGLDRHTLGREKFIERVWEWKEKYGNLITRQLKRLGASCDWSRERFTMDEGLSRAVREVFIRLYEDGLIYRGDYIINWCPRCHTALADLEVEHEEIQGHLYHILYKFKGKKDGLVVATTRPETLLGDTAVAVNPDDDRYKNLKGATFVLPILGREIPLIFDSYVDPSFGTGALKITPAHDPNDFEIGLRHNLDAIRVMDEDGRMNKEAGPYEGMDRFECREAIIKDLKEQGLLKKVENYVHSVGHCYRCKTMVEPFLSKQWFVRVKPLAEKAIEAVKEGKTKIFPVVWEKTYFDWMEQIKDWCISRQIWWGHRIPAWYCDECGEIIVAMEEPGSCKCGNKDLRPETDVLDTWFSSALWPFSTMGWPEKTKLLDIFYPTSLLVTGFDILFFWVARMMMMGLRFMGDVPFRHVYIHALVRDEHGQKMSKSKGNVIDPLIIMDKYGTDAFRFTLSALAAQGRDIKLSEKIIAGYRNFVNKLWNAARFSLSNLKDLDIGQKIDIDSVEKDIFDRWILSRLTQVVNEAVRALDDYRFNEAALGLYHFIWHEFCDWYLELIKRDLYGHFGEERRKNRQVVLYTLLSHILRLLHPFMPFVTEEIWQRLTRGKEGSIMEAPYPVFKAELIDKDAEATMSKLMDIIVAARNIRGEMNINPGKKIDIHVAGDKGQLEDIIPYKDQILQLAGGKAVYFIQPEERPEQAAIQVCGDLEVFIPLAGMIDFEEEKKRLEKELDKISRDLMKTEKKLANQEFLKKAPENVVEKEKAKQKEMIGAIEKLKKNLTQINEFIQEKK